MMARPTGAQLLQRDPSKPTGYSGVAAALNQAFVWPPDKVIDRRQVERWDARRTRNKLGQVPPSPRRKVADAPRTAPSRLHIPAQWIEWARAGVPGFRNHGWVIPEDAR